MKKISNFMSSLVDGVVYSTLAISSMIIFYVLSLLIGIWWSIGTYLVLIFIFYLISYYEREKSSDNL